MKKADIYAVEFAPDGKHFQIAKKGSIERMMEYFSSTDIIEHKILNRFAKFRLVNKSIGKIIATK